MRLTCFILSLQVLTKSNELLSRELTIAAIRNAKIACNNEQCDTVKAFVEMILIQMKIILVSTFRFTALSILLVVSYCHIQVPRKGDPRQGMTGRTNLLM